MDAALTYIADAAGWDVSLAGGDLASAHQPLRSAVIVSLFSDRRADGDDELPDPANADRRGWWADLLAEETGDQWGSRLWLLRRAKETAHTLERARAYAEEALQWLLDDGHATAVQVSTEWVRRGVLGLWVRITLRDGSPFAEQFDYEIAA